MGIEILNKILLNGEDVLDKEPHEPKWDRELACKYPRLHRGSVRLSSGRFYTSEEWEEKRNRIIKQPLP